MIDFQNSFIRLSPVEPEKVQERIAPLLASREHIEAAFKSIRDYVVFTNIRVIAVNVQGITGSKKAFTSMPYCRLNTFAIETAGTLDLDNELDMHFSEFGHVMFEFSRGTDIYAVSRIIAEYLQSK